MTGTVTRRRGELTIHHKLAVILAILMAFQILIDNHLNFAVQEGEENLDLTPVATFLNLEEDKENQEPVVRTKRPRGRPSKKEDLPSLCNAAQHKVKNLEQKLEAAIFVQRCTA